MGWGRERGWIRGGKRTKEDRQGAVIGSGMTKGQRLGDGGTRGWRLGVNEQGRRDWEEMDKEEETGKASQGAEIQAAQIKGWTDKETKIRVAQMQGRSLGMERQWNGHLSFVHSTDIHWAPTTREALCGLLQIQQGTSPTRSLASWCHCPTRGHKEHTDRQTHSHKHINIEPSDCEKRPKRRMCLKGTQRWVIGGLP